MRLHWPEYLMEAWGLGMFMLVAGITVTLMESTDSILHPYLTDATGRRALIGLAMGAVAIGIIYSPWGRQSGAHLNPAVTLTFLRLGKIARLDAVFYILAQFAGGAFGVALASALLGTHFAQPPVSYIVTIPGAWGIWGAFGAEFAISLGLMYTVLGLLNSRFARFTGLAAGAMIAIYVTLESPLSGTSMNPARTFSSALLSGNWTAAWIYFTAPLLGMMAAVEAHRLSRSGGNRMCAKLYHASDRRCIHCGYDPVAGSRRRAAVAPPPHEGTEVQP